MTVQPRVQASVRPANLGDLERLLELEEAGFVSDRFTRHQYRYLMTHAQGTLLVVEWRGEVAGAIAMVWRKSSPSCRVTSIVVEPAAQRRGVGQTLLQAAEELARGRGARRIYLEVRRDNATAIRFYRRAGYTLFGSIPGYYSDGEMAVRYEKGLPPSDPRAAPYSVTARRSRFGARAVPNP